MSRQFIIGRTSPCLRFGLFASNGLQGSCRGVGMANEVLASRSLEVYPGFTQRSLPHAVASTKFLSLRGFWLESSNAAGSNRRARGPIKAAKKAAEGRTAFLGKRTKGSLSQYLSLGSKADLRRNLKDRSCCASLENDAPFALAIGACLLSTLVIPNDEKDDKKKEDDLFGPDDMRAGAMQVISFIPLFNWLVWIFAWLDTGKQRYLAFAIVYLAPYLKTGLSLNPEDSWLPLASVLACIVHVQLDLSVTAEGSEPPLIDVSKMMMEKSQIKSLRVRTDGLVARLMELAERTDVRRVEKSIEAEEQKTSAEWKAVEERKERDELREFDERLAKSPASSGENVEEAAKEMDL